MRLTPLHFTPLKTESSLRLLPLIGFVNLSSAVLRSRQRSGDSLCRALHLSRPCAVASARAGISSQQGTKQTQLGLRYTNPLPAPNNRPQSAVSAALPAILPGFGTLASPQTQGFAPQP